jgi:hypothetical protein
LRSRFVAVHHDVYLPKGARLTALARAKAAWLWTRRAGVVAGHSASALHGAKWVDDAAPAAILYQNRRPPKGILAWSDRYEADEIETVRGVIATTPARTALDIACRLPVDDAVAAIDALARATRLKTADVELLAERYKGPTRDSAGPHRARPGRRGCGVAARDPVAVAAHSGWFPAAGDSDPDL